MNRVTCCAAIAVILFAPRPRASQAAAGDFEKNLDFASYLAADPTRPYVYATSGNSVEFINTNTLTIDKTLLLPSQGLGMSLSQDNSCLYVAGGGKINVVDLASQTVSYSLNVDSAVSVAAGLGNRLFVLTNAPSWPNSKVLQIDATTGASAGPDVLSFGQVYSGGIQITPDRKTLFYATYGLSPGSLYQIDVSNVMPVTKWTNPGDIGENRESLAISPDGSRVSYVCGYGYQGYEIPSFSTDDMSLKALFPTGAYPVGVAYSPDGRYAYAAHEPYPTAIDIYDTSNSAMIGQFNVTNYGPDMIADHTGSHLFVSSGLLSVYSTGYFVPEPSALALTCLLMGFAAIRRGGAARSH